MLRNAKVPPWTTRAGHPLTRAWRGPARPATRLTAPAALAAEARGGRLAVVMARRVAPGYAIRPDHDDDENEDGGECCENERVGHRLLWWRDHTVKPAGVSHE